MQSLLFTTEDWHVAEGEMLPFENKKLMKLFMALTMGKTLVLDEQTYIQLKTKHPRLKRDCIVLANKETEELKGACVCINYTQLKKQLNNVDTSQVLLIGCSPQIEKILKFCLSAVVVKSDFLKPTTEEVFDFDFSFSWVKILDKQKSKQSSTQITHYFNTKTIALAFLNLVDQFDKEDADRESKFVVDEMKDILLSKKIVRKNIDNKEKLLKINQKKDLCKKDRLINNQKLDLNEYVGKVSFDENNFGKKIENKKIYQNNFIDTNKKMQEKMFKYNKVKIDEIMSRVK